MVTNGVVPGVEVAEDAEHAEAKEGPILNEKPMGHREGTPARRKHLTNSWADELVLQAIPLSRQKLHLILLWKRPPENQPLQIIIKSIAFLNFGSKESA